MKNSTIYDYIKETEEDGYKRTAEFVKSGFGQDIGGFYSNNSNSTEVEHFCSYYKDKDRITYAYLRCPQLIFFICEVFGVSCRILNEAEDVIRKYEESNDFSNGKNGNYIWGHPEFREFKSTLEYSNVVKILKESQNIEDAKDRISRLYDRSIPVIH